MTTQLERRTAQGTVPPHNVEAEESVLGAVMLSADAANVALEMLRAEDFYKPAHQSICEAITALFDGNQPIDADHRRRLAAPHRHPRSGRRDRRHHPAHGGGAVHLQRRLLRRDRRRDVGAPPPIAGRGRGGVARPARATSPSTRCSTAPRPRYSPSPSGSWVRVWRRSGRCCKPPWRDRGSVGEAGGDITGMPTGFADLDHLLAGLHPTNLVVIAARPGMGKSTLAINIAANIAGAATDHAQPVALFTLEMSREEIVHRLLASLAGVDAAKIKTGNLDVERWPAAQPGIVEVVRDAVLRRRLPRPQRHRHPRQVPSAARGGSGCRWWWWTTCS